MIVFVSYAAERRDVAEQLAYALRNAGHEAFFDRADLPPAGDYNARIRLAIEKSELFVYCVSPESVEPDSYARTELRFAEQRFRKAVERVIPVVVAPTPFDTIPNFAKSVTVLEPSNVVAEVLDAVTKIASTRHERWRAWMLIGLAAVLCEVATFSWVAPRLDLPWALASLATTLVVLAPVGYWYWQRLALSGARFFWAAPLTLCAIATVAGFLAGQFTPVTLWVLPGTTLVPRMPAGGGASTYVANVEINGVRVPAEAFTQSGILLGANPRIVDIARQRGASAARDLMKAYLVERHVPTQFHEQYLKRWESNEPSQIAIRVWRSHAEPEVTLVHDADAVETVLSSRGSLPLQLVFVESRP